MIYWDEGVLTDLCLTGVLTDLCLTLYNKNTIKKLALLLKMFVIYYKEVCRNEHKFKNHWSRILLL